MSEELREVKQAAEPKQELNPFEYVTIPLKDYAKMIRKIEKIKVQKKAEAEIAKVKEEVEQYRRWWHQEQNESKNLKEALEDAKKQLKELLGVEEVEEGKA